MNIPGAIVILLCSWWLFFLMLLPFGVNRRQQDGATAFGAPAKAGRDHAGCQGRGQAVLWFVV